MPNYMFRYEYVDSEELDEYYYKQFLKIFPNFEKGLCLNNTVVTLLESGNLVSLAVLEVESGLIPGLKQDVYISWIGTFEEFRTKGYVSELLSNIIDNSSNVGLTVFYKNTRAISLYKKFGFSVCNRINYPDGETDLVMHKLVKYHTG